jgi:hypothetical protein
LLGSHPKTASLVQPLMGQKNERDKDIQRKRESRAESARITIPACVNPQRRERAIGDPELFLMTYFASDYTRKFGKLHHKLIESLVEIARHGGKQAIAAPRGRGKTQIVKGILAYLVFAGLVRFPVPIGPTTNHARELYEDFRRKVMFNDLLLEDFPEVCFPVRALEGAPQRAGKQHIDGVLTRIQWTADGLRLADVPAKYRGDIDYGGVRMEFRGLDASIRGINRDGDRPDFVPIDEPETRESAKSESQIQDRENAIEKDINGLAGEDRELAQVMITTVQNNFCNSAKYTDPEIKPSWMGQRFGWVEKWPYEWEQEEGKWHTYIAMRAEDQRNGDRYGRKATEYYLENQKSMDAGGELLADNYVAKTLDDGWVTIHSAWQVVFNQIADTSFEAFCTEYQNQPPEQEKIQTLELTHGEVASSRSGLERLEIPVWKTFITRGIDMGKVNCWFVDVAWNVDGTGTVVDYGKFTTFGLSKQSSHEAIESAMLAALESFVAERDGYDVDLSFVDSGYKPDAIYEACRRIDGPYYPLKGPDGGRFRVPNASEKIMPYFECYASQVFDAYQRPLWLFHPNTECWKNWTQERWQIETWETQEKRTPGSMSLFEPPHGDIRFHTTFAKSMISERLTHVPLPGKGYKTVWEVIDRGNNHWLDCMGYAAAAAAVLGVRLVDTERPEVKPVKRIEPKQSPFNRGGRPFLATQR